MKSFQSHLKAGLIPLALGAISSLVFYFVFKVDLTKSLEYSGIGILVLALVWFFVGNADRDPRHDPKNNPAGDTLYKKSAEEAVEERKRVFLRQSIAIVWGIVGFLFLAAPLLFWKG